MWRWHLVEDLWADLRYAVRQWRRTPAFAIAAIVTLAVGIGANTAVFSLVNGLILRPLPFPNADRLVAVASVDRRTGDGDSISYPNFFDMRRDTRTLSHLASYRATDMTLTGRGLPVHLRGQIVSWELFQTLDVAPALGRAFVADDEKPGTRVVVLGHETWTRIFGADPAIVSTAITLNGEPHVVAGVAPEGFVVPHRTRAHPDLDDAFDRSHLGDQRAGDRAARCADARDHRATGPGGLDGAGAGRDGRHRRHPWFGSSPTKTRTCPTTTVRPEIARLLGPLRPGVLLLWGAVGLVLLLACANVSNLLVARTADREREFDVRLALGGSRGRIVRQLIAENLLLGLAGSAAGIAVAYGVLGVLLPLADGLPTIDQVALDLRVLLFAAAVAVARHGARDRGASRAAHARRPHARASDDEPHGRGRAPADARRGRRRAGGGQPGAAERGNVADLGPRRGAAARSGLQARAPDGLRPVRSRATNPPGACSSTAISPSASPPSAGSRA